MEIDMERLIPMHKSEASSQEVIHSCFLNSCYRKTGKEVSSWFLVFETREDKPSEAKAFNKDDLTLPFDLDEVFKTLSQRFSSGARVVTSHPQGREGLKQKMNEFSDVVSDLPDDFTLKNVAKKHLLALTQFVDERGFYLVVLKFSK